MRVPWWGWLLSVLAAGGGAALVAAYPREVAYWVSPLLVFPLLVAIGTTWLSPWFETPVRRRAAAWAIGSVLAAAGAALVLVEPGARNYLIGLLLLLPLATVATARIEADDDEEDPSSGGGPAGSAFGLPDF